MLVLLGLALRMALYLSTPHEPLNFTLKTLWPKSRSPQTTTKATTTVPGTVDFEVRRGKNTKVLRFSKQGETWSIRDVTPQPGAKPEPPPTEPLPPEPGKTDANPPQTASP